MDFTQSANNALAELKANPRLRWGLWGIVGVCWLYGILELRDDIQNKGDTYRALSKKTARIKEVATQEEWLSRRTDAQALRINMESRLWRENTIGLAQATFQDWLNQLTQQANLAKAQLAVAAQEGEGIGGKDQAGAESTFGLWKVSAKLSFDFNPQSFYPLLTRIATHEKKLVMESLTIRSTPSPRVELLLVAYYLKPGSDVPAEVTTENDQRREADGHVHNK